jgi:DNA invertase Pin-like site-specific DNA recombinase
MARKSVVISQGMGRKPKAAIYIRVSTAEQAKEGYSLGAQEESLTGYVKNMNYDIYKIYKDEGKSAKDMKHRPALQQLLKDAENKQFNAVIVYKLDRFSRSLKDLILTIEKLKDIGIDFISLQDKIETASAAGKLMFHIISSFAEFERDIISERTKFGMSEKAREGGTVTKAAYGYKIVDGNIISDPEKCDKLREIFETYLNNNISLSKLAIKYDLTTKGLISILKNRTYIGELRFNDIYSKGQHDSILSKELFDSVQLKLDSTLYHRENIKYSNLLQKLSKKTLQKEYMEKFTSLLSKKIISMNVVDISVDSDEDLSKFSEPKKLKCAGQKYLLDQGFNSKDISFDRVFINADKADICGINGNHKTYLYHNTESLNDFLRYISEHIIVGFLQESEDKIMLYTFRKELEF